MINLSFLHHYAAISYTIGLISMGWTLCVSSNRAKAYFAIFTAFCLVIVGNCEFIDKCTGNCPIVDHSPFLDYIYALIFLRIGSNRIEWMRMDTKHA